MKFVVFALFALIAVAVADKVRCASTHTTPFLLPSPLSASHEEKEEIFIVIIVPAADEEKEEECCGFGMRPIGFGFG